MRNEDDWDEDDGTADGRGGTLRIDRLLWCLRFYKTRSAAAAAVSAGRVLLNGQRPKPSRDVAVGDRLEVTRDQLQVEFAVLRIPARRGPATEAQSCYGETEQSVERRAVRAEMHRLDALSRPQTEGRPDKRERRVQRDFLRRQ